jgi:subtilisin family serine protease
MLNANNATNTVKLVFKRFRLNLIGLRCKALGLLVLALFIIGLITPITVVGAENALGKLHPSLIDRLDGVRGEGLRVQGDSVFVFVRLNAGYHASDVEGFMATRFVLGSTASPIAVFGMTRVSSLLNLAASPAVSYIFPDVKLGFDQMKPDPEVYTQHLATDMYKVRQILGADRVNQLGISGNGVTIAIVDTGTDFTIPDLSGAVARNDLGQAISFDADGQSFALTNLTVTRFGNVLETAGKEASVWNAASYTATNPSEPQIQKVTIHYNYVAPDVLSKSGYYHFGLLREEISDVNSGATVLLTFPVVVVDANKAGVYDTVVVDMSTAYYNFLLQYRSNLNSDAAQTLNINLTWPSAKPEWNDHGFADEQSHMAAPGKDLIYFDPNNTGVPVFSAGTLAYGIDLGGFTGKNFALLPPIDSNGNFINVLFDFESHGTSTASNAASRGILKRDIYQNGTLLTLPGIAPAAKIIGVKALWLGDTTFAWYYAAGFDWNPTDFSFKYTGNHRADIISNSWGDSDPILDLGSTFGADLWSQLVDAFTLPHYLDPAYPGVVMLVAAGNGGSGYGTVTSPAAATLAITVGASTNYAYRTQPGLHISHEEQGSYDEVVPFSARGPTSIGETKPDVVDVGAFGFTSQSTFTGYGNGTSAYTVFGGTSMSTPVTAGGVALIIEEYRNTHEGATPPPDLVKSILASTATDLSYDQFTQGSGRVDVWDAVAAAAEGRDSRLPSRFYLYSPATWDSVKKVLGSSWAINMQTPIPATTSVSADWYAGVVLPASSTSTTFDIQDANQVSAQAYQYTLISSTTSSHIANSTVTWVQIPKSSIPANADLMKVTLVYHFSDFVNATSWSYSNLLLPQIYDTRFDSAGHISRLTNAALAGTTAELVVGKPLTKFRGTPAVRVVKQGTTPLIIFQLVVQYYQRSSWNWITRLSTSNRSLTVTLTVPAGATPGVYGGFIAVSENAEVTVIPTSVFVPIVAGGTYQSSASQNMPYTNFDVYGAFNWEWRYEAGDWRTFAIIVPPGVSVVKVHLSWSDSQTLIEEHLTGPLGFLVASSEYPTSLYDGNGKFRWYTNTGGPAEDISASAVQPGLYFLVLHNVLFGGSLAGYPENYTLNVEMT